MTCWHITAVVVTHEGAGDRICRCLAALERAGGCHAIVVVDNSPTSLDRRDPARPCGPAVDAVIRTPNRGYGAAANEGFGWARAHTPADGPTAVALLNDDVVVRPGWVGALVEVLERDERIGAVQPKILFAADGRVNSAGVELDRCFAGSDVGFGAVDGTDWTGCREVEAVTGGAVLFRSAFLSDTGGFDERFFLYYEDVDLSLRGRALGWRLACQRDALVDHEFGASTAGLGDARLQLQERNHLWVAARHAPPRALAYALGMSVKRLAHPPRRVHAMALLTGLAGMPARLVERRREGRS